MCYTPVYFLITSPSRKMIRFNSSTKVEKRRETDKGDKGDVGGVEGNRFKVFHFKCKFFQNIVLLAFLFFYIILFFLEM